MSTQNILFDIKEIKLILSPICSYEIFSKELKEEFSRDK